MNYFGTVRQNLWRKNVIIPPSLSIKYFPLPEVFWNTEWFPGEVFSVLWDEKILDKTVKPPPSFAWKFSIPEFFQNTEGFSCEFYRHCETKIFQRSLVISPFLCIKICETRNFLKHRSVLQRDFSVLCEKKFSTEKRDTPTPPPPPLPDAYIFSIPEFFR